MSKKMKDATMEWLFNLWIFDKVCWLLESVCGLAVVLQKDLEGHTPPTPPGASQKP